MTFAVDMCVTHNMLAGFTPRANCVAGAQVTTIAGTGEHGYKNGSAKEAQFNWPTGVAVDLKGDVYITDSRHHVVRLLCADTGTVETLAGTPWREGYVPAQPPLFARAVMAFSAKLLLVVVVVVVRYEDGPGDTAKFHAPRGIVVRPTGGTVYVADCNNHRIRCIRRDVDGGGGTMVTTVAGNDKRGCGDSVNPMEATFRNPVGLSWDASNPLTTVRRRLQPIVFLQLCARVSEVPRCVVFCMLHRSCTWRKLGAENEASAAQ